MSWGNFFTGKGVIVTGGGRGTENNEVDIVEIGNAGIGRALCVELDRLGARVFAVSKNPDNLKSLQAQCSKIHSVCVDLSDWNATRDAIAKLDSVDMLVNNAGVCLVGSFFEVTERDFDTICSVNLKAIINVSQIVAKKMIDTGKSGSIVNISSIAGLKAFTVNCAYCTLKAGLDQLTKIMALELGPSNIRVNSVNPGAVITDMLTSIQNDLEKNDKMENLDKFYQRIATPKKIIDMENVVNSILFLLSDSAPMITGTTLAVDGGYNIS